MKPYDWAREELKKNIKEFPGHVSHNPRITWYHSFTTLKATADEVPWCSSFMCAAAFMGGHKSTKSAAAISWEKYGEAVDPKDAKVGDILIFKRKSSNPNARHVTFLHSDYKVGDVNILCLGGNQSNAVRVSKYPASDLVAIRRFPSV